MKIHCGELCAVYNKKFSSFALHDGKDGGDLPPYQVSPKFRPNDLEKFIMGLRKWLVNSQIVEGIFLRANRSYMNNGLISYLHLQTCYC